jgi:hypothetical protein
MSRHHMLPPIIYTPPPKPKKIETRRRRIGVDTLDEFEETAGAHETAGTALSMPVASGPLAQGFAEIEQGFAEIEGADRKPRHPSGRLSQSTLSALLRVQELK